MAGMEETGGTDGEQAYRGEDGEVTVRLARVADIAMAGELTTMVNEAYREGYVGILEEPSAYTRLDEAEMRDRISAVPSRKGTRCLILAEVANQLAGCASATTHWFGDPSLGQFGLLATHSGFRRRGVATALISCAEELCRGEGATQMQCEELVADDGAHVSSVFLAWHQRRGYEMEQEHELPAGLRHPGFQYIPLAQPCRFVILRKGLG
eukprot:TRINITY_DN1740_c0_g1_i8.p1 TRINITY_DN1740_c0_g1~~TRINITY_DN1740_c0_g1_i8.p1  ORF type:complete len:210 (-),score=38.21 TRINITY_DN1740_c0_g1_i8:184-813(-)